MVAGESQKQKRGRKDTEHQSNMEDTLKEVDLGEPTSILDHVYLGCTQRECETSKDIVDNYRTMFESRISAVGTEKKTILGKSVYIFVVLWREGSCQEMCGTILWVGKQDDSTTPHSINSMPWWPPLQRRRNKICWRIVKVCSQIVPKCLYLARIGRPDILRSVNKMHEQSPNGPELVLNAWLVWLWIFITQVNLSNIAMWETLHNNAGCDCFRTLTLLEILKTQNRLPVEFCVFWEVTRLFPWVGCARDKLQFHTVQQNPKSSLWTLDWDWTGCLLWIYGIWLF